VSDVEKLLLDNALQAHDRLWDAESSVIDLWALYAATAEALRQTAHHRAFELAVAELAVLMQSGLPADEQRNLACGSTDPLRQYVVQQLGVGSAAAEPRAALDASRE
jgi:hypothetical protein